MVAAAGVEYGVVRATFQQQLQQMLLTVLALWIPLIPLLFLAQRLVDSRNNTRRAKSSNPNTPRITFADVAGEPAACSTPTPQCTSFGSRNMPLHILCCAWRPVCI
jgi:hypothetical protein